MPRSKPDDRPEDGDDRPPRRPVRLPGFVLDEDIGLGTALKHATSAFGIQPCGGCERRAAALDQWFILTARRPG